MKHAPVHHTKPYQKCGDDPKVKIVYTRELPQWKERGGSHRPRRLVELTLACGHTIVMTPQYYKPKHSIRCSKCGEDQRSGRP